MCILSTKNSFLILLTGVKLPFRTTIGDSTASDISSGASLRQPNKEIAVSNEKKKSENCFIVLNLSVILSYKSKVFLSMRKIIAHYTL
ncbi:hypothetical protein DSECCO2_259080 [anaerobic digester metagenome]